MPRRSPRNRALSIAVAILALLLGTVALTACDPASGQPAPPRFTTTSTSAEATTTTAPATSTTTTAPPTTTTTTSAPTTQAAPAQPTAVAQNPPNPPAQQAPADCGAGYYRNSDGNCIQRPAAAPGPPPGATALCNDGTYSFSAHRSGTCSYHGGVKVWL